MNKPWHWWTLAFGLYGTFVFVMFTFIPREVAQTPEAITFADFMAQYVPMLDQIKKIQGYQSYLRFYYAVLWILVPWAVLIGWRIHRANPLWMHQMTDTPKHGVGYILFFAVCTAVALFWPVHTGQSWRDTGLVNNIVGITHHGLMVLILWVGNGGLARAIYARLTGQVPSSDTASASG